MSYEVFFDFSTGLAAPLQVPVGTKARYLDHVERLEETLGLKRDQYRDNPVRWAWPYLFEDIDDEVLCVAVEEHNRWVRCAYEDIATWARAPVEGGETLTPEDAAEFWHGFHRLTVEPDRWTEDYYRARMECLYEVMRGRPTEGISLDEKALSAKQASAVIHLFAEFLDPGDLRLEVPRGCDHLAGSDAYRWCERCGAVDDSDGGLSVEDCRRRGCPLKKEDREADAREAAEIAERRS